MSNIAHGSRQDSNASWLLQSSYHTRDMMSTLQSKLHSGHCTDDEKPGDLNNSGKRNLEKTLMKCTWTGTAEGR